MRRRPAALLAAVLLGAGLPAWGTYCSTDALVDPRSPMYPATPAERGKLLEEALGNCRPAAEAEPRRGHLRAALATALALKGDLEGALPHATAAMELGWDPARPLVSTLRLRLGRVAEAVAALGDPRYHSAPLGAYNLGVARDEGIGTQADPALAFEQFHLAAAGRDAMAMLEVAQRYLEGRGVPANRPEAEAWWRKAAESLAVESWPNPARWPRVVPYDPRDAMAFYRERAAAGEPWAQAFLGLLYERGAWLGQDVATAIAWYRRAAEHEHEPAEHRLALIYSVGRGVPRDRAESLRWTRRPIARMCEASVASNAQVPECDRYAGDPYDPAATWQGVAGFCMPTFAERAEKACRAAVQKAPDDARLRAQYARALAHLGRFEEARREAALAARRGSTGAMVLLAYMDELGYGGPRDLPAALAGYRRAAQGGDERALRLFRRHSNEEIALEAEATRRIDAVRAGVQEDPERSLQRRAQAGEREAMHDLAFRHAQAGEHALAAEWYARAAAKGHGPSVLNLGQMYETGTGVRRDIDEALRLYRKRAETGDKELQWRSALLHGRREEWTQAAEWLRRGSETGDTRATTELAGYYRTGKGVPKDARKALALYEKAAPHDPWAQFQAGLMHYQGDEVPRNLRAALVHFTSAAKRRHAGAMNNVGFMHDRGEGTAVDPARALDAYVDAARSGSNRAHGNLQDLYESGRGVPRERAQAIDWYRRGAEVGVWEAMYRLALLYEEPGPHQDLREAMRWHLRNSGDPRSLRAAARLVGTGAVRSSGPDERLHARIVGAAYEVALLLGKAERLEKMGPPPRLPRGIETEPGPNQARDTRIVVAGAGRAIAAPGGGMDWSVVIIPPPPPGEPGRR